MIVESLGPWIIVLGLGDFLVFFLFSFFIWIASFMGGLNNQHILLAKNLPSFPRGRTTACLCLDSYKYFFLFLLYNVSPMMSSLKSIFSFWANLLITFLMRLFIIRKYCFELTALAYGSFWTYSTYFIYPCSLCSL